MTKRLASHLNALPTQVATDELRKCCGSTWWCAQMVAARPFADRDAVRAAAGRGFDQMPRAAWLEAFASHPRIGDLDSLQMRYAGNHQWSAGEQSGMSGADSRVLVGLRDANNLYYDRFGYSFIVCASGKSATEMLTILQRRLTNDPEAELREAAGEQRKITLLRIDKLEASLADE